MSFIYGHDENAMPSDRHQSSNAYANGADQNCGNVITDRPSTRLHAPPGGHSSISFGADAPDLNVPRLSRETQQNTFGEARSNVHSQVFGAPSDARAHSSNAYANGADQNCGNFITDRPSTRLHAPPGGLSQIAFGDVDNAPTETRVHRPDTVAFAAKEREHQGSDIFGAAPPQQPREARMTFEDAPPSAPVSVEATEVEIKAMTHGDLRVLCREHGLSPAGAKETLVERIVQAMHCGQMRVMVANKGACGVSSVGNNYGRAEGQNVGNFMTGRNSSRVLAPPGGGSSFSLANDGSEHAHARTTMSEAKLANDFKGHDVFDDGPGPARVAMNSMKSAHLRGHDVFDDSPDAERRRSARQALEPKRANDLVGHDVFGDVATPKRPSTALSDLKRHEMLGQNIFADGQDEGYRKNTEGEMRFSDARAAAVAGMVGNDIFSDGDGNTKWRAAVQVTRPPGGAPSNVTF